MSIKQVNLTENEIDDLLNGMIKDPVLKKLHRVKNKKRIKISSAKGKGRALQYWLCNKISQLISIPYVQSDDNSLIRSREMGQHGTDIILRNEALQLFPYSPECKNSESFNIKETVKQAIANQKKGTAWLIVYKCKQFKKPVVVMDWDNFEYLIINTISEYKIV